nr:MAG TPA: hypothetical protein [Caudoviricetes sp.]
MILPFENSEVEIAGIEPVTYRLRSENNPVAISFNPLPALYIIEETIAVCCYKYPISLIFLLTFFSRNFLILFRFCLFRFRKCR